MAVPSIHRSAEGRHLGGSAFARRRGVVWRRTTNLVLGYSREIKDALLTLGPVDPVKGHTASEHLRFQIGGVLHPIRGFADAKSWFLTQPVQFVVYSQCPSGSMMHHQEAIIRERLIVHGTPVQRVVPRCRDSFCSEQFNDLLRHTQEPEKSSPPSWRLSHSRSSTSSGLANAGCLHKQYRVSKINPRQRPGGASGLLARIVTKLKRPSDFPRKSCRDFPQGRIR